MLKKTITYTDYNGEERTEDFYFNLTQAEVIEMELSINGSYTEMIKRITSEKNGAAIMREFKEFIRRSYGRKSLDGVRFEKSDELSNAFMQTEAYNVLFMELVTNADYAAAFVEGVLPKVKDEAAERTANVPAPPINIH